MGFDPYAIKFVNYKETLIQNVPKMFQYWRIQLPPIPLTLSNHLFKF